MMKTLNRIGTRRDVLKRIIEMRQIFKFHGDMKFSEMRRAETKFTSRYPIVTESSGRLQVAEVRINVGGEVGIENAVRKIAPDVINVDEPYLTAD